jgi:hypothetical protein
MEHGGSCWCMNCDLIIKGPEGVSREKETRCMGPIQFKG